MIHLSFVQRANGTTIKTLDFNAGGRVVAGNFTPQTGGEKETVMDAFDLFISGGNAAGLQAKVREIEAMLAFAKAHPRGPEGVWVLYSPDSGITAWQSRLSDGALLMDERIGALWRESKTRAQVVFERGNYWETQEPVTLLLSNGTVTEQTAAPIDNCQDSGHDLYAEIGADQVTGVLPTPAILSFGNTQDDETLLDQLTVGIFQADGLNTPPTPGSLIFEGTGSADVTCSSETYQTVSWASDTEALLKSWTLASGAFLQKRFQAVVRMRTASAYTDLRLKVKLLAGGIVIAETRWSLVPTGFEHTSIGSLTIPPYPLGEALNLGNLTLGLYGKRASGAGSFGLDFLILLPQDGWRRYGAISGLAYGETLIDDPVRQVLVTAYGAGSWKVTHMGQGGDPLMLKPGVKNILYFLQDEMDGDAPIGRTGSVSVKIHPRRLTV